MTFIPQKCCYKCEQTKPITEFARRSGPKSQYRNICQACSNEQHRRRYRTTPGARAKSRENMRKWRSSPENRERARLARVARNKVSPRTTLRLMIFNARKRAEVLITLDELFALWEVQDGCCAVTGIRMTWSRGRIESTSISLDRIDPDKGYTLDNVRLVCHAVNCFRGRMTDDDMFAMALAIVTNMKRPKLRLVS